MIPNNSMVSSQTSKRGDVKGRIFKSIKDSLLKKLGIKKDLPPQQQVEDLFKQAFIQVKIEELANLGKDPNVVETIIDTCADACVDACSDAWAEARQRIKNAKGQFSYPLELKDKEFSIFMTDRINLKEVRWKRKELYEKGKTVYGKLKEAYSELPDLPDLNLPDLPKLPNLPSLPDLPGLPELPFDIPDLNFFKNIPDLKLPNLNFKFPSLPGIPDWRIPYPDLDIPKFGFSFGLPNLSMPSFLSLPDLGLPDPIIPDLFYGFVFDLGLNLPFVRIFSSIKTSAKEAKNLYKKQQTVKKARIDDLVTASTSQLHVALSAGILNAAKSSRNRTTGKFVTHLTDFVSSLIPGGSLVGVITSGVRTGLEYKILWEHHAQIKAMNNLNDPNTPAREDGTPIQRTTDNHYIFTMQDIPRFPVVACRLINVLSVKELFGLTKESAALPQIKGDTIVKLQRLQKNKNFTRGNMQELVNKVYKLYYENLIKASISIEGELPYSIVSN